MSYSELLKRYISQSKLSLSEIEEHMRSKGFASNKSYISKLQNGIHPPAGEDITRALAEVTGGDVNKLIIAAQMERLKPILGALGEELFKEHLNSVLGNMVTGDFFVDKLPTELKQLEEYHVLLRKMILLSGLTLGDIVQKFSIKGESITTHYLSRLQNGRVPPASEKVNDILSDILHVDRKHLRLAAVYSTLPNEFKNHTQYMESVAVNQVIEKAKINPGDKATLTLEVTVSQIQHNVRGTEIVLVDEDQRQYILPDGDKRITFKSLKETGIKESGD